MTGVVTSVLMFVSPVFFPKSTVGFFVKDRLGQALFGDNTFLSFRDDPGDENLHGVAALALRPTAEGEDCGELRWDRQRRPWRHEKLGITVVNRPRPPGEVYRLWSESRITLFALEHGASADTLAFLREFNSYFDVVVCVDEGQWAILHRYMWDARALEAEHDGSRAPRLGPCVHHQNDRRAQPFRHLGGRPLIAGGVEPVEAAHIPGPSARHATVQ
ncbi:MAG: hypothetical protein ACRELA_21355 [Candidatus Rokuibacteriota bacterium]